MSEELARLGLEVDSDGFVKASRRMDDFSNRARKAERRTKALGDAAYNAGRRIGRGMAAASVAVAGIAANAVRMGVDFESELTKINTLVGVSRSQIDSYREGILSLAPAVGRGPTELASAMFAITSAGTKGADAMELLEVSAKAAAIGLGETRDIALAAGAAVTAFGKENLSASDAVGILVGTVEQGNLEASELAGAMGQVNSIAAAAGITFQDAGAFVASFTRQGVSATQAVTALRGTLATLVREPTQKTIEAFEKMDMSIAGFREQVRDEGFIVAFQELVDKAQASGVELGSLIPEVEALSGSLAVFTSNGESAADILEKVAAGAGSVEERFQAALETDPALAFAQLRSEFSALSIELGTALLPAIGSLLDVIKSTDDEAGALEKAFVGVSVVVARLAQGVILVIAGFNELKALAIEAVQPIASGLEGVSDRVSQVGLAFMQAFDNDTPERLKILQRRLLQAAAETDSSAQEADEYRLKMEEANDALFGLVAGLGEFVDTLRESKEETEDASEAMEEANTAATGWSESLLQMIGVIEAFSGETAAAVETSEEWKTEIEDLQAEVDGPLAQALLQYERNVAAVTAAVRENTIEEEDAALAVDLYRQILQNTSDELERRFIRTAKNVADQILEITHALMGMTGEAVEGGDSLKNLFGGIGSGFAQSVFQGQGIRDALSSSLTGLAGSSISDSLGELFSDAAEKGIGDALESKDLTENKAAGFALALGQAIEGNIEQGILTGVGAAFGGEIGAAIGSILGEILFGDSKPKFQVRGRDAGRATDAGTDFVLQSALGETEFAFRKIEDEIKRKLINAVDTFDTEVAGAIRDADQLSEIDRALDEFAFSSRSDSESLEELLLERMKLIAGTFDQFAEDFILSANTLQGQMQNLADVAALQRELLAGRGLGLTGAGLGDTGPIGGGIGGPGDPGGPGQPGVPIDPPGGGGGFGGDKGAIRRPFVDDIREYNAVMEGTGDAAEIASPSLQAHIVLLDELRIGSESLMDTYERLVGVMGTLDTVAALTGASFGETREAAVRFGADLVAMFGDNADALAQQFGRIFDAFFSDAERAEAAADLASMRGEGLLRQLLAGVEGVDFSEEFMTRSGFRDLFDQLLAGGDLTADQIAMLTEAGVAIADLIEAEEALSNARSETQRNAEAIAETLESLELERTRRGLEGVDLALFDANREFDELREQMIENGATADELATLEKFRAEEILAIRQSAAEREIEIERRRADEIQAFQASLDDSLLRALGMNFRAEFARIQRERDEMIEQAEELGVAEQFLGQIRALEAARLANLAESVRASLAESVSVLWGDEAQSQAESQIRNVDRLAEANRNRYQAELTALQRIQSYIDSTMVSDLSPLTPGERVAEAERQFNETLERARAGDIDAQQALPGLADTFLQLMSDFTGGVGEFPAVFDRVMDQLSGVVSAGPTRSEPPSADLVDRGFGSVSTRLDRSNDGLTELERQLRTGQVVQELGLLSRITGDTPAEIANELGIPIGEVVQAITGQLPDLTGDALSEYFNELVGETNAQLNQMGVLENIGSRQVDLLTILGNTAKDIYLLLGVMEGQFEQFAGAVVEMGGTIGGTVEAPPGGGQNVTSIPGATPQDTFTIGGGNDDRITREIRDTVSDMLQAIIEGNNQRQEQTQEIRASASEQADATIRVGDQLTLALESNQSRGSR